MKFLCDSCKTKYQIPDEKVAGRTLRMKCRKCGHMVAIDGALVGSGGQAPAGGDDRHDGEHVEAPATTAGGLAEAFSALFQAGLVFASAALVMQACVRHLMHPEPLQQTGLAVAVLIVSIVLTLGLVSFQNMALRGAQSVAVSADRMHYLTDLVTNLIALAGVAAAILGFPAMDAAAGFIMAGWFVWGAVQVLREAASHLMDEALGDADVARLKALALEDPAITGVHELRTRLSGPYIAVQMHVEMDPRLSLAEAHRIIIAAETRLLAAYPNADILIHPDPRGEAEPHGGVFHQEDGSAPEAL